MDLLQRVHQSSDGAIKVFVGSAHLFDLIDRVQHGGVMLAAKLRADFLERCPSELPDKVHGDLAILAHLPTIDVLWSNQDC